MGKRFTDTEKWGKKWFRKLPPIQKLMWYYVCEDCDAAGVFEFDAELIETYLGEAPEWEPFVAACGERLQLLPCGKYWITTFIEFQYGKLSPECKPHKVVYASLEKHGITYSGPQNFQTPPPSFIPKKGIQYPLDTLQEKDKEEEKEKEGGAGGNSEPVKYARDPSDPWKEITRKLKSRGVKFPEGCLNKAILNGCNPDQVEAAVAHYDAHNGAWQQGALFDRIRCLMPEQDARDLWPAPSAEYAKAEIARKQREQDAHKAKKKTDEVKHRQEWQTSEQKRESEFGPLVDAMPRSEAEQVIREKLGDMGAVLLRKWARGSPADGAIRSFLIDHVQQQTQAVA